jgi:tRNA modification GTPase
VAIVRVSGPRARAAIEACFQPRKNGTWRAGRMRRGWLIDPATGAPLDDALAVLFPAPNSYTGEDVAELHVHGGAGVVGSCLSLVLRGGARMAEPGEFTRRAFFNGRMDLGQAEAVADLIGAQSRIAANAAAARLDGAAGRALREMRAEILVRLVEIEANVDYPDEVPEPDRAMLAACVRTQAARIDDLLAGAGSARILRDGLDCVIAGPPNAGKSSLLNALLEAERAIVSDIPGTTRDIVEESVAVDGVALRLRDTAGLRATSDVIEAEGVARARRALESAELVLLVLDGSKPLGADERAALATAAGKPRIVLCNKADLGDAGAAMLAREFASVARDAEDRAFVVGSVLRPATIETIRSAIARLGWGGAVLDANAALVASARQIGALVRARESLQRVAATLDDGHALDLASDDLRSAAGAYGEVTGETVTAEVLDGIFSRFCVGK